MVHATQSPFKKGDQVKELGNPNRLTVHQVLPNGLICICFFMQGYETVYKEFKVNRLIHDESGNTGFSMSMATILI